MKKTTRQYKAIKLRKRLKVETANLDRQYVSTFKDIKRYFTMFNKVVFNEKLAPFNDIKLVNLKSCRGEVVFYEWERKGTEVYHLHMLPKYKNKREFLDTLCHEMIHLYQMRNEGDTGNHNELFYSFRPRLKYIGLDV